MLQARNFDSMSFIPLADRTFRWLAEEEAFGCANGGCHVGSWLFASCVANDSEIRATFSLQRVSVFPAKDLLQLPK